MLTDEKKKLIELEEQYRHDIKKSLEAEAHVLASEVSNVVSEVKAGGDKLGAQIMVFLNSSVGMWLLSSVVITGGAAVFQQIQHQYEVNQKNQAQLISYKFEIENRLDNMAYALRQAKTVGDAKAALGGLFKSKYPLTPELQNRSLESLYLNIYELLSGTQQQKAQSAIDLVRQIGEAEILLQSEPDAKPIGDQERIGFSKLIKSIQALHLKVT